MKKSRDRGDAQGCTTSSQRSRSRVAASQLDARRNTADVVARRRSRHVEPAQPGERESREQLFVSPDEQDGEREQEDPDEQGGRHAEGCYRTLMDRKSSQPPTTATMHNIALGAVKFRTTWNVFVSAGYGAIPTASTAADGGQDHRVEYECPNDDFARGSTPLDETSSRRRT